MSLNKRLEALEGRAPRPADRSEVRARMKASLDEIAAARSEGRAPSEEAAAVMEAIEKRSWRAREP